VRKERLQQAMTLVEEIAPNKYKGTSIWNPIFREMISQGNIRQAVKYYRDLIKRGARIDSYTKTVIFNALAEYVNKIGKQQADPEDRLDLMRCASDFGQEVDERPLRMRTSPEEELMIANTYIRLLAAMGNVELVSRLVSRLARTNRPDIITYQAFFGCLRKFMSDPANQTEKAAEIAVKMIKKAWHNLDHSSVVQDGKIVSTYISCWAAFYMMQPTLANRSKALQYIKQLMHRAYGLDLSPNNSSDRAKTDDVNFVPYVPINHEAMEALYESLLKLQADWSLLQYAQLLIDRPLFHNRITELLNNRCLLFTAQACKTSEDRQLALKVIDGMTKLGVSLPVWTDEPKKPKALSRRQQDRAFHPQPEVISLRHSRAMSTLVDRKDRHGTLNNGPPIKKTLHQVGIPQAVVGLYMSANRLRRGGPLVKKYSSPIFDGFVYKKPASHTDLKPETMGLCVIISNKVSKSAVIRNRIRRRTKEAIRMLWNQGQISPDPRYNYVLLPRLVCYSLSWQMLVERLRLALKGDSGDEPHDRLMPSQHSASGS